MQGKLYVVATPIGNLADMTYRAVSILNEVNLIAAEDTRHTRMLLDRYGVSTPMQAIHQHNEARMAPKILDRLIEGDSIALVSDAGTPLIRDPGFPVVELAISRDIHVIPIPGCCALVTALSVAGLPADAFTFIGFPPRTASARREYFGRYRDLAETILFYESSHRILECVSDLIAVFGGDRRVCIGRELTKKFETFLRGSLDDCYRQIQADENQRKGEFVVVLEGARNVVSEDGVDAETFRILDIMLEELSVKSAAALTSRITGVKKKVLYQAALERKAE